MSARKYYDSSKNANLNTNISYELYDKNNSLITSEKNINCFRKITYDSIPKNCTKIVIDKNLSQIPYSNEIISRWIDDLNGMGFPCSEFYSLTDGPAGVAYFSLILDNYKSKPHLICGLQLIRYLFENLICYIPDYYFKLVESGVDKFESLQIAHKDAAEDKIMYNWNHTVTFKDNFKNPLSKKELFARLDKFNSEDNICTSKRYNICGLWENNNNLELKRI